MSLIQKNILLLFLVLAFASCKDNPNVEKPKEPAVTRPSPPVTNVKVPRFNVDRAYDFVVKQCDFGPRVPGTPAHTKAKNYFIDYFKGLGFSVIPQEFTGFSPQGAKYTGTNIIAAYKPDHVQRIILAAHWDSRYTSDYDKKVKDKPVMGADDGASGVGILMSIAQTLIEHPIDMGVDFVLFDVEDQGKSNDGGIPSSWCQGSQYWAANLHAKNYHPRFGILLDMVGAKDAFFAKDEVSRQYAGSYVNKIWKMALDMGYSNYFQDINSSAIIDDHLFVNQIAKIPMLDIINRKEGAFGEHWHTQQDVIDVIDKETMKAVGQVVTAAVYQASAGRL